MSGQQTIDEQIAIVEQSVYFNQVFFWQTDSKVCWAYTFMIQTMPGQQTIDEQIAIIEQSVYVNQVFFGQTDSKVS